MNSNLVGLFSVFIGINVMALTLVVIFNEFGNPALPGIFIGAGSILAVIFILVAFASPR